MNNNTEKEKYEWLSKTNKRYGSTNHGKPFIDYILKKCKFPLIDIGCGRNGFVSMVKAKTQHNIDAIGIDFAFKEADIICSADCIPLQNDYFNTVVSFDFFEHLLPDNVDKVIQEIIRLSNNKSTFFATISNVDSVNRGPNGETLHPTIRSINWWLEKFSSHNINIKRNTSGLYEGLINK